MCSPKWRLNKCTFSLLYLAPSDLFFFFLGGGCIDKKMSILKDVIMTFHRKTNLVAYFIGVKMCRVVENCKMISYFFKHFQSNLFSSIHYLKANSIHVINFLINCPLKTYTFAKLGWFSQQICLLLFSLFLKCMYCILLYRKIALISTWLITFFTAFDSLFNRSAINLYLCVS